MHYWAQVWARWTTGRGTLPAGVSLHCSREAILEFAASDTTGRIQREPPYLVEITNPVIEKAVLESAHGILAPEGLAFCHIRGQAVDRHLDIGAEDLERIDQKRRRRLLQLHAEGSTPTPEA